MQTKKRFFRKVATPAVFGVILLLLTACPSKEPVHIDLGRIPEQYLATVPYQNGDVFRMQHETSKVIIEFEVERHRHKTSSEGYGTVPTRFEPAPDYYYEYEVDMTTCKPKYPVFDLSISLSNAYMLNEEEMQQLLNTVRQYSLLLDSMEWADDLATADDENVLFVSRLGWEDTAKLKKYIVTHSSGISSMPGFDVKDVAHRL